MNFKRGWRLSHKSRSLHRYGLLMKNSFESLYAPAKYKMEKINVYFFINENGKFAFKIVGFFSSIFLSEERVKISFSTQEYFLIF